MDVEREVDYFSAQTENFRRQIGVLSGVVGVIMGIGAVFAALNTMFAAVAARAREIATLRAIGFGGLPVLASVLIEAMLLALAGGLLGAALVWLVFNNYAVTTLGQGFTQVVFQFRVTADLLLTGVLLSLAIGFIGGLWPALRAARLPVTVALREA
ncbi:MAG: ABC transporter permease [Xanthomonadales bacterium]|nr:ABC transporter permease [Xanthomonadales bacterium]